MDIVLIAGLWLDGSAWDEVAPRLEKLGHRPVPVTLPGQGDGSTSAALEDQVGAVFRVVRELRDQESSLPEPSRAAVAVAGMLPLGAMAFVATPGLRYLGSTSSSSRF